MRFCEKPVSNPGGDLLPQDTYYADEGCELTPACLSCPMPRCAFDEPGGVAKLIVDQRNEQVVQQAFKGKSPRQLSTLFNLSLRSIQRILQPYRNQLDLNWGYGRS